MVNVKRARFEALDDGSLLSVPIDEPMAELCADGAETKG